MTFIIGGGVLGAAVARVAARTGPVMVGSLTPRAHPGLWVRFDLTKDGLPRDLSVDARIVVAIGAADPQPLFPGAGRTVVVIGPTRVPGAAWVWPSPVWDLHERSLQPVLDAMRQGKVGRLPRGLPTRRWLWAEDVARVALSVNPGEEVQLQGPVLLDAEGVALALVARERGSCGTDWLRAARVAEDPPRDDWDEGRWGGRRRL